MSKTPRNHYGYDERRAEYRHARREDRQHMPETTERATSEQDEDRREREQQGKSMATEGASMSAPAHTDLQAALDAEHAQRVADLEAETDRLRGLLRREQQERHAALAEVDRVTEAGRAHVRRAAAFEAQRDELAARLAEIEAQEPVALVEASGDQGAGIGWSGAAQPVGAKLYARPVTAQAAPDGWRPISRCDSGMKTGGEGGRDERKGCC